MEDQIVSWIKRQGSGAVAVLRHNVAGLVRQPTSDWDIAVVNLDATKRALEEELGRGDLSIERRYVNQNFVGGEQIDLFERFEWNGFCFLEAERFWSQVRIGDDGIPRPGLAHDALIALFVGLLGGGTFANRYCPLIELALEEDGDEFQESLEWALGNERASDMMSLLLAKDYQAIPSSSKRMRRAIIRESLIARPTQALKGMSLHWITELRHHLKPPFPWIAVLGPDGAGKSTVIDWIIEEFSARRLKVHKLHWRPAFCRGTQKEAKLVSNPHDVPPRGVIGSILKLGYFWCDWIYSHLFPLRHLRAKNKLVIADRFYIDLLVDPIRYRYGGPLWLASLVFRFYPKPDLTIVLTGDATTLYQRKKEVRLEEVSRQVNAYQQLANRGGLNIVLINATKSVDQVCEEFCEEVLAMFRERR